MSVPQSGDHLQAAACLWCLVWVFIMGSNVPPNARPALLWELGLTSGRKCQLPGDILMHPLPRCVPLRVFCSLLQALYDHLMDFLADRGVDNTFADELIELSTALEHQEYIKFLEDLKSFVKCQ